MRATYVSARAECKYMVIDSDTYICELYPYITCRYIGGLSRSCPLEDIK